MLLQLINFMAGDVRRGGRTHCKLGGEQKQRL